jgi:hypothetical protein
VSQGAGRVTAKGMLEYASYAIELIEEAPSRWCANPTCGRKDDEASRERPFRVSLDHLNYQYIQDWVMTGPSKRSPARCESALGCGKIALSKGGARRLGTRSSQHSARARQCRTTCANFGFAKLEPDPLQLNRIRPLTSLFEHDRFRDRYPLFGIMF